MKNKMTNNLEEKTNDMNERRKVISERQLRRQTLGDNFPFRHFCQDMADLFRPSFEVKLRDLINCRTEEQFIETAGKLGYETKKEEGSGLSVIMYHSQNSHSYNAR